MPNSEEQAYLLSRAVEERARQAAATDPAIATIHRQLADEYEARAEDDVAGENALRRG